MGPPPAPVFPPRPGPTPAPGRPTRRAPHAPRVLALVEGGVGAVHLVPGWPASVGAERTRLLAVERAARERAELVARVKEAVGRSLDLDETVRRITQATVPTLADWCVLVVGADQPADLPIVAVAHVDQPVDRRLRKRLSKGRSGRNGVDDVAERAKPDDEERVQEALMRARRSRVE